MGRSPIKRRRFLQGSAAAAFMVGLPVRASRSSAPTPSCDPIRTEPHFTGSVPSPVDVLGFALGVEREVTAAESNAYVAAVSAASDRVTSGTCAVSVQGRDIRYAIVGLPEHMTDQGLAAIQADIDGSGIRQTPTADVAELVQTTPAILWVEGNIHGNEESGCDTTLQLLYELADSRRLRRRAEPGERDRGAGPVPEPRRSRGRHPAQRVRLRPEPRRVRPHAARDRRPCGVHAAATRRSCCSITHEFG